MEMFNEMFDQAAALSNNLDLDNILTPEVASLLHTDAVTNLTSSDMILGGLLPTIAAVAGPRTVVSTSNCGNRRKMQLNLFCLSAANPARGLLTKYTSI